MGTDVQKYAEMKKGRWSAVFKQVIAATMIVAAMSGALSAMAADHWIDTWTANPQPVWNSDFPLPTNIPASLSNRTIRQIARVSIGGRRVRIVLSNEYGAQPLMIGAAHIAIAGTNADIVAGSDRMLTFNGRGTVTIPPGAPAMSDPVELDIAALGSVSISLFLPEKASLTTFHWDGLQTAYVAPGNQAASSKFEPQARFNARVFLTNILIDASPDTRAIAAFGDSITDGNGSTPDANRRWPDFLARRMAKHRLAVLNAGISGGRLLKDAMGVNALARFDRDVLSRPGIASVILLIGINDISWPGSAFAPYDEVPSADDMVAGYRQLIARAHARNVRVVGATLTPFEGALQGTPLEGYYNEKKEVLRQAINHWVRTSGEFDSVADFDTMVRDPAHARRFLPVFDSGDHLHPGDEGNEALANSIELRMLIGRDYTGTQ